MTSSTPTNPPDTTKTTQTSPTDGSTTTIHNTPPPDTGITHHIALELSLIPKKMNWNRSDQIVKI